MIGRSFEGFDVQLGYSLTGKEPISTVRELEVVFMSSEALRTSLHQSNAFRRDMLRVVGLYCVLLCPWRELDKTYSTMCGIKALMSQLAEISRAGAEQFDESGVERRAAGGRKHSGLPNIHEGEPYACPALLWLHWSSYESYRHGPLLTARVCILVTLAILIRLNVLRRGEYRMLVHRLSA